MIATDLDSPKNAKIEYELMNHKDEFSVDPVTGLVVSKIIFDFEQTDSVELKIRAKNPSDPSIFAETILKVSIEGENEFFPKFRQPVFQFAVSESAQIGDVVGQVEAPDVDKGKDGEVFYYIVGFGSGFAVDRTSGIIRVRDPLDRESQNRYVLTVLAKNGGSIRGNDTDEAQVIIQVQDGNDPPVFRKSIYTARVSEAAAVGTSVVTVSAVDKDVRPRNSQFSYSIFNGNIDNKFNVDPSNGVITVEKSLDREEVAFYNLTVRAVDNGAPPAIGETHVHISLDDVNDSPPALPDLKAFVKENNPPGSIVKQFDPTDPDPDPNAGPFSYTLLPGKNSELFVLDSLTGVLKTSVSLDREQNPTLDISVRIEDAGSPKLSADFDIVVEVGDENDNPSTSRSVDVVIKNYEGTFPGGEILFVRPADPGEKPCRTWQSF
jgi:protocadherin Fat 4